MNNQQPILKGAQILWATFAGEDTTTAVGYSAKSKAIHPHAQPRPSTVNCNQ